MADTLISICIPTYNGEKYLEECLRSALNQTYRNIEIIISDDNSSDKTIEIVRKFQLKDNRVKYFINENNLGLSGNWNRCIELASGEWIKFIFQDDIIYPNCIAEMLEARGTSKMIVCEREFIFESGTGEDTITKYDRLSRLYQFFPGNSARYISPKKMTWIIEKKFPNNFIGEPSSLLFSKECISVYGGFLTEMIQMMDIEFVLRIAVNEGLTYLPKKLVSFRVHNSSASQSNISSKYFAFEFSDRIMFSYKLLHESAFSGYRGFSTKFNLFFISLYMYYMSYMALSFVNKNRHNNELQKEYLTLVTRCKGIDKYSSFSSFFIMVDMLFKLRRSVKNYFYSKTQHKEA